MCWVVRLGVDGVAGLAFEYLQILIALIYLQIYAAQMKLRIGQFRINIG